MLKLLAALQFLGHDALDHLRIALLRDEKLADTTIRSEFTWFYIFTLEQLKIVAQHSRQTELSRMSWA